MYEKYKQLVVEYVEEIPDPAIPHWKDEMFFHAAYLHWAGQEILKIIENNPDTHPVMLVKNFTTQMEEFSLISTFTSTPFSIAKDLGEDLLLYLYASKEE